MNLFAEGAPQAHLNLYLIYRCDPTCPKGQRM